jgi:signal transduction histidine kinase
MVHPDDREMVDRKYTDAIKNNIPYECVHRVVRPDGTVRIVHEKSENIVDEFGQIIHSFGMTNDITEQKLAEENRLKLEQQIQRSKKMESLGLMAGGIAHDLNNILSGIVSYPELLLMQLPDNSPLREPIETIKDSGKRAADVVSDLLTVVKGVATGKKALNLNTIIKEYLDSIEHKRLAQNYPGVVFENDLDAELLNISCSSLHMKKILMNLVLNASEAIERQGKVAIKTANRYLDEPLKGYEDVQIGEYVLLTVSDTGSGISRDDIEMIFEPFFTKKVMGRGGTGLGLAVVWNIVHDHDGYINVTSSEEGTIFELYFAVTRDEVTTEEEHVSFEDYLGSGERILVVDDEQNQREIACKLLTQMGYTAEAVSSGEEAIQYLEKHAADLIVLDMIMPGMNGRETYERIIKIHPDQKAIIASGFAETEAVKAAQKLGAGKYVKKPYTLEKIGIAVRDELKK